MAVVTARENKVERVKRERDGLDCLEDLLSYAKNGFAAIPEEDLDVRLRWYGLYTQRPKEDGLFMLRVKIPNGTLSAEQLEKLGRLSVEYAGNTGDTTTRQDVQLHNVRIEDVPHIFAELADVGLSTSGACGDITRNVTGCPLAGIDGAAFVDAEPLVEKVHQHFLGNREFSNLPRKFKITISGCSLYCTSHEINDIGLIALRSPEGEVVFDVWVGGGLGSKERFADRLGAHISPREVVEVTHHICAIFRDHGNRGSRGHARLKFLLGEWGPGRFRAELEKRLGRKLVDGDAPPIPSSDHRAHIGVHPQREDGLFYVGAATTRGKLPGTAMLALAELIREHAGGRVRLTTTQNLVVLDVPKQECETLAAKLAELELYVTPSPFRSGTLACTGKRFCKLAVTETKERASEIIAHLEENFPGFDAPFRISVTGCPNSCAHYQVCEIGLVGDQIMTPEGKREAYRIYLGGYLGDGYAFGRELDKKIPADDIKFYIERLTRVYLERRDGGAEKFRTFIARHTAEELEALA